MVALEKKTGKEVWRASTSSLPPIEGKSKKGAVKRPYGHASYSSAIVVEVGGVRQYVQFLSGGVVGISAKDGKLLWHYDHPANAIANCSTPIFRDNSVFAASAYNIGGGRASIKGSEGRFQADELFFVKKLQNHHGGMVLVGDHVYGTGGNLLMCVSFKTGEIAWQSRGVGKGSVAYADGHIYHRGEDGKVALVEATPTGYKEKSRFSQPDRSDKKAWAYPVIVGGKLYLRDWDVLLCYDIKDNASQKN
jgi:outer membrane protein assembly factor BamB